MNLATRNLLQDKTRLALSVAGVALAQIGHDIMHLLRRIAKEQDLSVVIVSHDQRIKDVADRVLWLEDGEFKEMALMATDPVCGMAVERDRSVAGEWGGQTFYFCSRGCKAEFMVDPETFVAPPSPTKAPLEVQVT